MLFLFFTRTTALYTNIIDTPIVNSKINTVINKNKIQSKSLLLSKQYLQNL